MNRKQVYDKIVELNLQETVKKECGRNYTQVPTSKLEEIVNKASKTAPKAKTEKEVKAKEEVEVKKTSKSSKPKSTEERLAKLIEILGRKRILLQSEIEELV